ncbi:hypothetical protein LCGC14_1064290 [marine sediment metagenome]|uniref:Uncharacterized protein n=2 Tax=root TaxID=1 RepID=A0A831VT43_9FLAO|nr:hypothetical protein [Pricia sp.]HEA22757.1 hypothetical protein [Pricia antarctica]
MKKRKPRAKAKPSQGLGDDIERITEATGIKKAVELFSKATGIDCKCKERKEFLNKKYPRNNPNCFNETQYNDWIATSAEIKRTRKVTAAQMQVLVHYLKEILNMAVSSSCNQCNWNEWQKYIDKLDEVAATYQTIN